MSHYTSELESVLLRSYQIQLHEVERLRAEIIKLAIDGVISFSKGAEICGMDLDREAIERMREFAAKLHQATNQATVARKA